MGALAKLKKLKNLRISINFRRRKFKADSSASSPEALPKGASAQPLTFKEFYPVNAPFGYVGIDVNKETGKLQYLTVEPTMDEHERRTLRKLKTIIKEEANVPLAVLKDESLIEDYLTKKLNEP